MSSTVKKTAAANEPRIGEMAAMQPLSGITSVNETFAVNGLGHAGYVRREENEKAHNAK